MQDDRQAETLRLKISEQDQLFKKLRAEQSKLHSYITQFEQAIKKKVSHSETTQKLSQIDEQKLQRQLQKQIENAKTVLKNNQHQYRNLTRKNNKLHFSVDDLIALEDGVKAKDAELKELEQEIKNLNALKRKQEKLIQKKQRNEDGSRLTKLIEQVRKQKEGLQGLQTKHMQKAEALQKKKIMIKDLQATYAEKCRKVGEEPISYEEFKAKRRERKKQEPHQTIKSNKKYLSVKEIINSQLAVENVQSTEKNLRQLKQKREIAENALKNARKKHEREIEDLNAKLQSLKEQNQNLNIRLLQKRKEKEIAEAKANETKKDSAKATRRRLTPIKS